MIPTSSWLPGHVQPHRLINELDDYHVPNMVRQPSRELLNHLAPYDPHVSNLTLALREVVLEEAPKAIESIVNGYALAIGFSFTGKPLKDGFCHVVAYSTHVNLGFNRGATLLDPSRVLCGKGKSIRHITIHNPNELDVPLFRRYIQAAIEQVSDPSTKDNSRRRVSVLDPRKRAK